VDVVVDPVICQHLRDHQRQGVTFMYECLMDMKDYGGEGVLLADESTYKHLLPIINGFLCLQCVVDLNFV
jgi:hypothetical protein